MCMHDTFKLKQNFQKWELPSDIAIKNHKKWTKMNRGLKRALFIVNIIMGHMFPLPPMW